MESNTNEPIKMPSNSNETAETKTVSGPVLVLLAVALLALLGGLYYWFTLLQTAPVAPPVPIERPSREENDEPESPTAEAQADTYTAVSTSDEITAIESDVEATNLDSLDAELNAIDAEFEAAVE